MQMQQQNYMKEKKKMQKVNKEKKVDKLQLIPKSEKYIQYIIELIIKIPRTEKYSIGTEYKLSMYKMLENIMYLSKIREKELCLKYINNIDSELNCQRIYLRIMYKNKWIDERKFKIAIEQIYEIGKIIGGLLKYYGKMDKK